MGTILPIYIERTMLLSDIYSYFNGSKVKLIYLNIINKKAVKNCSYLLLSCYFILHDQRHDRHHPFCLVSSRQIRWLTWPPCPQSLISFLHTFLPFWSPLIPLIQRTLRYLHMHMQLYCSCAVSWQLIVVVYTRQKGVCISIWLLFIWTSCFIERNEIIQN